LEIDLQRGVEGELKGLILLLTHWVRASAEFVLISKPHEYWCWLDHTATCTNFKKEMWVCSSWLIELGESWIVGLIEAAEKAIRREVVVL
jgi:hypothetical protein